MYNMKLVLLLITITTVYSLNVDECNEIGKYKNKFIFICSQVLPQPSSSTNENIAPSPSENIVHSIIAPSPSENVVPSIIAPSPPENIVHSIIVPSSSENVAPSPSENVAPSPSENVAPSSSENVVPSSSENVAPSPESTVMYTLYEKINKVIISPQLNSSNNYTNTTQLIQPVDNFNIGFVLIPLSLLLLIVIFYHVIRKKSSKIMCDSGKEDNLPVIKLSLENDDVSEKSNETIHSPPPPPTTLPPPPRTPPTKPHYDIENPPPVPPRKNNKSN